MNEKPLEPTIVIADVNGVRYQIIHIEGGKTINLIGGKLDISMSFDEWDQFNAAVQYLDARHRNNENKKRWGIT